MHRSHVLRKSLTFLIGLCICGLLWWSFDVQTYESHHVRRPTVVGDQSFLQDVIVKVGPTSEGWVLEKIQKAKQRIWVGVYTFTLPNLREALLKAKKRGVDVRVILEKNPYGSTGINRETLQFFRDHALSFHESTEDQFAFMHAKYAIIDQTWIVETANWVRSGFSSNRELFMTGTDTGILASLEAIFGADFEGRRGYSSDMRLLAGPTNARERLLSFITDTEKRLDIYAPSFSDKALIHEIESLCASGREVRLLVADHDDTDESQMDIRCVQIRKMSTPLHAKALMRDKKDAFIGSFNYTDNSLENNREIGIFVSGDPLDVMFRSFESDWARAVAL